MQPITIVVGDNYSDWEIGVLAGVGRAFFHADIRFASHDGGPLTSAAGLEIRDTRKFAGSESGVIVVCGGPAFESEAAPDLTRQLRDARLNGCIMAGICGGTVALARAGLLDDVRHTSNHAGYLEQHAPAYRGAKRYVDQPFAVRDGMIITAPAPAPASFADEVLRAAGLDEASAAGIKALLAREHAPIS